MNFALLASLIIVSLYLSYALKRQARKQVQTEKTFWARERQANSVRRKPLDNLEYITIPLEKFPIGILQDHPTVAECIETLEALSSLKIVNLTGYSNTDLKLEYGTANITVLTEYDQNYTLLVRTLQKWADVLLENNYVSEAEVLMEFAINTRTDISRTYYKLAEIYATRIETQRIHDLIKTAETLQTSQKDTIVRTLRESYL